MTARIPIAALMATTALAGAALAQATGGEATPESEVAACQELLTYISENDVAATGMTRERAERIAAIHEEQVCQDALRLARGEISEAEGDPNFDPDARARLLVAVPEPEVTVTQSAPQVTVDQPQPVVQVEPGQPVVTVNQAEPVVTVELTPPAITIDMPKPQILVEMPDPSVDVRLAQPRVSVEQPEPQVQVEQGQVEIMVNEQAVAAQQPEAPEVTVEQDEATVTVEEAENARVQVAEVQPAVRYNAAEPRIEVQQAGEPQIQFNQPGEADVQIRQLSPEETRQMAAAGAEQPEAAAAGEGEPDAVVDASTADDPADGAEAEMAAMSAEELTDAQVVGANGEAIGDVEDVMIREDATYVIVGHGGFLGLGEQQIALPIEDMRWRDGQLVMREITSQEVERMEEADLGEFQAVDPSREIEVMAN